MAQRLIFTLGAVAEATAMQNALDMRAAGDTEAEQYWLSVYEALQTDRDPGTHR
jgi:hypothetical protein